MPKLHYLSTLDEEMLDNDFKKFHISKPWNPDYECLDSSYDALEYILEHEIPELLNCDFWSFEKAEQEAEKKTACGFYWKQFGCTTKGQVFELFRSKLKDMISDICINKIVDTIWETSPKIEIRSLEKLIHDDLSKRKQRTFMCCEVLCYVIGLMLYGDQNEKLLKLSRGDNWSAVGSSIFYGGWHQLALTMLRNRKSKGKVRLYDISAMEASISPELFRRLYNIRNKFLNKVPENFKPLIDWFVTNKIYSKVIDIHGNIGIKIGMNPSGCLNTLTDNTLICFIILLYHISSKLKEENISFTYKDVIDKYYEIQAKCMGDDSMLQDDLIWDGLETTAIRIGFTMKPEVEGAVDLTQTKPSVTRFLNFGFVYNYPHQMFTFSPNYDKLFAGLYYYRKKNSWRLTLARLCAMKVLCFTHPKHLETVKCFINYIWQNHKEDLRLETRMDDKLSYNSLRSLELSDKEIEFLIFGLECGTQPDPEVLAANEDIIQSLVELRPNDNGEYDDLEFKISF